MLNRNAVTALVGAAVLCLVLTAYSVGRMNGMEAGLQARLPLAVASPSSPEAAPSTSSEEAQAKEEALYDTQRIAQALLKYARSHNETFPPAGNLLTTSKRISQYIDTTSMWFSADDVLMARGRAGPFYYTFDAKPFGSLANPAVTRVGYKDATGGRAWAFADGHVEWEPRSGATATPNPAP